MLLQTPIESDACPLNTSTGGVALPSINEAIGNTLRCATLRGGNNTVTTVTVVVCSV